MKRTIRSICASFLVAGAISTSVQPTLLTKPGLTKISTSESLTTSSPIAGTSPLASTVPSVVPKVKRTPLEVLPGSKESVSVTLSGTYKRLHGELAPVNGTAMRMTHAPVLFSQHGPVRIIGSLPVGVTEGYVRLKGVVSPAGFFIPLSGKNEPAPISVSVAGALTSGEHRVLVIPVIRAGKQPPYSIDAIKSTMNSGTMYDYFHQNSSGSMKLVADVTPWITVSADHCALTPGLNLNTLPELGDYVRNNGISLSNYNQIMFVQEYCTIGGWAGGTGPYTFDNLTYNLGQSWILGGGVASGGQTLFTPLFTGYQYNSFDLISIHELAHNLGLPHAHGFDCATQPYNSVSLCQSMGGAGRIEYGDLFDVMGNFWYMAGFNLNTSYRKALGWLPASASKLVTEPGEYLIADIDSSSSGLKQLLIKPLNYSKPLFTVEYRAGNNHDTIMKRPEVVKNTERAQIRLYSNTQPGTANTPSFETFLIDADPTGSPYDADVINGARLPAGGYFDPKSGVSISSEPVMVAGEKYQKVKIGLDPVYCIYSIPTVSVSPKSFTAKFGDYYSYDMYYVVSVKNTDITACGSKPIRITATFGSGTPTNFAPIQSTVKTVTAVPETISDLQFSTLLPEQTPVGNYLIKIDMKSLKDASFSSTTVPVIMKP